MSVTESRLVNLGHTLTATWPTFLPPLADTSFLDHIWAEGLESDEQQMVTRFLFDQEVVLAVPGVDAISLTVAASAGGARVPLEVDIQPALAVRLVAVPLGLRLSRSLFKPVRPVAGQPGSFEPDPTRDHVDITLGSVTLAVNGDGDLTLSGGLALDLPACMIGDSGVVVEATGITLHLDSTAPPPGKPPGWKGIHIAAAHLHLPGDLGHTVGNLSLTDGYIGNGGFSGTVASDWAPPLNASVFGMTVHLSHASLTFVQNALAASEIRGQLTLPFFDTPVDVVLAVRLDGGISVALASSNGLAELIKPGVLSLRLESLGFAVDAGVFTARMSGTIRPLVGGLDWPGVRVHELSIDSEGHVRLEGGWLDLPDQYHLSLYGFQFEVTRLGFGSTDDGGKWIGFSGGLKLVEGLSAGASVEGLRVSWYPDGHTRLTLNGVSVEFEVPGVLRFQGAVSYRELPGNVHRFDGSIRLILTTLDLEIDGTIVIGRDETHGYTFFALYVSVDLPAGIPLWTTGLGLYGLAGLFAIEMEPGKAPDEPWYAIPPSPDWYHRGTVGVTDLTKWTNRDGSLGLGAGATIGTVMDNGFTFAGRFLLAIVFPGPILFVEGRANLLAPRSSLNDEPVFRALAVLDGRAGTFLVGLDAQYKFAGGGEVIDIGGSAEALFNFNDPGAWHLYLGIKDPRERRIHAQIFHLFEANAYFMLDPHQLAMGAFVGYDRSWRFGPVRAGLSAWIAGDAVVSFKPVHFHGELWLHGSAELKVFGFGFSIGADARVSADVFDPFGIEIDLSAHIGLPWPLPDFDISMTIAWGPEKTPPPLPLPLKEVAIEHFKVTTSWPLPRGGQPLLLPSHDSGGGFLGDPPANTVATDPPPIYAPVVPLDARPHLTFGMPVHDDALVGVNPQPPSPEYIIIGDTAKNEGPVKVRFGLRAVVLERWQGGAWEAVAGSGNGVPAGTPTLFGSWAPTPDLGAPTAGAVVQTKLWLWSRNGFDYTRHTTGKWNEWFAAHMPNYPCVPLPDDEEICCDFRGLKDDTPTSPWVCPEHPEFRVGWLTPPHRSPDNSLCFAAHEEAVLSLDRAVKSVRIFIAPPGRGEGQTDRLVAIGVEANGATHAPVPFVNATATLDGKGLRYVRVHGEGGGFCLRGFCVVVGLSRDERRQREEMASHVLDETARWQQEGFVLAPYTQYRARIVTTVQVKDWQYEGDTPFNGLREQTEYAFFRTEGPPGVSALTIPANAPHPDTFSSGLDDLTRYVRQTVPLTVPVSGEKPFLPRPVYRAYDVGVVFNEDYVDLLYRVSRRDLGLYLYDNNARPARDAYGRLLTMPNRWGTAETRTLTQTDSDWLKVINASTCVTIAETTIPRTKTLGVAGQVLDADTVYEARLVPLLLHENFATPYAAGQIAVGTGATLPGPGGGWVVHDSGTVGGPSRWIVGEGGTPLTRYVEQQTGIHGGALHAVARPGTLLLRAPDPDLPAGHPDQATNWTDYRVTAVLRSADVETLGLVFRYRGDNDYYLFAMNQQHAFRRLTRVMGGGWRTLAGDHVAYTTGSDVVVTVEAIGDRLRVTVDGQVVCDVRDSTHATGGIGLYSWGDTGARFADIRVDDLRGVAPAVYRFKFTTSRFADFTHHLHSATGDVWTAALSDHTGIAAAVAAALPPSTLPVTPTDVETNAYSTLARKAVGERVFATTTVVEATRITDDVDTIGLLLRTSEPIDWSRTSLVVQRASGETPAVMAMADAAPAVGRVKIIGWSAAPAGVATPIAETVTLLLDDMLDVGGYQLEYRTLPSATVVAPEGTVLLSETFLGAGGERTPTGALLSSPPLNDLTGFVQWGPALPFSPPPQWAAVGGQVMQTALTGVLFPPGLPGLISRPGALLIGADTYRDCAFSATLRSDAVTGGIGMVFRYTNPTNWYRFSMYPGAPFRQLVRCVEGVATVLWQDAVPLITGQEYAVIVEAVGGQLRVRVDGVELFQLYDTAHPIGQVGLYTWRNIGAVFTRWEVTDQARDIGGWRITDIGALATPSVWVWQGGGLLQTAAIAGAGAATADATAFGTYAVTGLETWTDVRVETQIIADGPDAVGIAFRWRSPDDHYLLLLDGRTNTRRVIRKTGGATAVLWQGTGPLPVGQTHDVDIEAVGTRLRATLNGIVLCDIHDNALPAGGVGVFVCATGAVRFGAVTVIAASPHWLTYATLSSGERLAAGTRVCLYAGRESDLTTLPVTGEVRRFQGFVPGNIAGVRLPVEGIDLRLRAPGPNGTVIHARRFPGDALYAPQPVRVLRAPDSTGVIVLVPDSGAASGSRLSAGVYRLRWTFRRDNTAAAPDSIVLRQNGDDAPEQAEIVWQIMTNPDRG